MPSLLSLVPGDTLPSSHRVGRVITQVQTGDAAGANVVQVPPRIVNQVGAHTQPQGPPPTMVEVMPDDGRLQPPQRLSCRDICCCDNNQ